MANPRIKSDSVAAVMERFAFILFAPSLNKCRDGAVATDANFKELIGLLIKGYDVTKGVASVFTPETAQSLGIDWDELLKNEMELRRNLWEDLKGSRNTEPLPLEVFEEMYVHNGKLIEPKYLANMCFQRGSVFFKSMVERRKLATDDTYAKLARTTIEEQARSGNDGSLRDLWPVTIRSYADEGERISDQLNENTGKNRGATPLSDLAQLKIATIYWDLCYPQTRFRKEFSSDTMGQKLYYICELNARFPSLRIVERMRTDAASEQNLPFTSCKHTDLTDLAHATDPDYGRTVFEQKSIGKNQFLLKSESFPDGVKHPAKGDVVEDYFRRLKNGPITPPIMKRKEMLDIIKQSGNDVIKDTVRAILENNMDHFQGHLNAKHEHNLLCEIQRLGGLERANRVLTVLLSELQSEYAETRSQIAPAEVNGQTEHACV